MSTERKDIMVSKIAHRGWSTVVMLIATGTIAVGCSGQSPTGTGKGGQIGAVGGGVGAGTAGAGGKSNAGGAIGAGAGGGPIVASGGNSAGGAGGSKGGTAGAAGKTGNGGAGGSVAAAGGNGGTSDGCIRSIYGTYVVRKDGVAIMEGPPETVVVDATSGTAATPLAGVITVQQQQYAACALVSGGIVKCWQQDAGKGNMYGQLGNGTLTPIATFGASTVLTAIGTPLTNVVALASGVSSNAACAVTSDKKLWCWGDLTWIVNNGATDVAPYAQAITLDGQTVLTGVLQATVGYSQACALLEGTPNSVWCWGTNAGEELGQGDTTARRYPTKVNGLTTPSKVVLEFNANTVTLGCPNCDTTCVLDGESVLCWGYNRYNAVGSSAGVIIVPAPTLVTTSAMQPLRGVTDLIEGPSAFGVLRNDGTIWLWGTNGSGQAYASSFGVTNIVQLGWAEKANVRYLTSDGIYHKAMTNVAVNCGAFQ